MTLKAPQLILIAMILLDLGYVIGRAGQPQPVYDPIERTVNHVLLVGLLWWGGFFGGEK